MARRRGTNTSNTLDISSSTLAPSSSLASPLHSFPRSPSPSGFSNFLAKPARWFNRSSSATVRAQSGSGEPRASTGSNASSASIIPSSRKPRISQPTDPRPILGAFQQESYKGAASRSVLDVSQIRPSLDASHKLGSPRSPSSNNLSSSPASTFTPPGGFGDLRSISRKAWSKSADDLSQFPSAPCSPSDPAFYHKVNQYRNRSNSNASTGAMPKNQTSPHRPNMNLSTRQQSFPTIITTSPPPSSSPLQGSMLAPSPSLGSPTSASSDRPSMDNGSPTRVRARSPSFAPRMPSKLSVPKGAAIPPSPSRKGSGSSEIDLDKHDDRSTSANSGTGSPSTPVRGAFPFGFGPNLSPISSPANRGTTLLTPPVIIEPVADDDDHADGDEKDTKRTSQVMYHSGFINRLSETPPPLNVYGTQTNPTSVSLVKGWKPFKLELKGSKLYFYKPPGDRTAAVKELFPTHVVLEEEDEGMEDEEKSMSDGQWKNTKRSEREETPTARKKRAFWGRRKHPDLVYEEGSGVQRGSFEALVHEAVFGTQSLRSARDGSEDTTEQRSSEWKNFAAAILLCLPSLVGAAKFESEFTRCCSYLITGAESERQNEERERVGWLASEYLRYHGRPAAASAWEEWRKDTIPDVSLPFLDIQASIITKSSSMQALYVPSPVVNSSSPELNGSPFSPNLGMFSPRPEHNAKLMSLVHALGGLDTNVAKTPPLIHATLSDARPQVHSQIPTVPNRMIWTALEREGLSRDVLLMLDPHFVARSLFLFHRAVLQQLPENLTADFFLDAPSNKDRPAAGSTQSPSFTTLFGSDDHPHWLTKLLLKQILGVDTSSGILTSPHSMMSPTSRTSEERNNQTSRTHSRSEVITAWAKIGELCRLTGDECSWRAISAALCSRPVARLEKAWKRVDPFAKAATDSWVHSGPDGELAAVKEPRLTPWGGDVANRIKETLEKAHGDGTEEWWSVQPLTDIWRLFEGLRTTFALCPRQVDTGDSESGEDIQRLMAFWVMSSESEVGGGSTSKFTHVDHFMSLSFVAEPRRKGLFASSYWTSTLPSSQASCHPLVPLLFPEPLPTVSLVDRAQIWRGRLESGASRLNVVELQKVRDLDRQLQPLDHRNHRDADSKDALGGSDVGGTVMRVFEGELVLVVQTGGEPITSSSSRPSSRPPSSAIDFGNADNRMSRAPSIRVKPGSALERKTSVARRSSLPSISQRPNVVTSEPSTERPLRVLVQAGTLDRLVDILVHGLQRISVSVADDNGEMPLREEKTRDLVVDHDEFARVWWSVFRSFVTPIVFFEFLRKRYIGQGSSQSVSRSDLLDAARSRSEVLETIKEWIQKGNGAQDALDDPQLFVLIQSFLDDHNVEHKEPESECSEDKNVRQAWIELKQFRRTIASLFTSQTMRPSSRHPSVPRTSFSKARSLGREPPDIDSISPDDLVRTLDAMAAATFSNVTQEDLFVTSDLLEVQTADRTGWFLPRDPVSTTDDIEIQTIYSHFLEIEPSHTAFELTQDTLYRLLPPGIRSCIRAYGILRKWLISKLVAPKLGLRTRQARMDLLLRSIEVARLRSVIDSSPVRLTDRPCIRSFVEAVLTSAVLSGESRLHHRPWQNIALTRSVQADSLSALLSKPVVQSAIPREPLTVDMGWVLERILELISIPDIVDQSPEGGQSLVNFDKRRHLCNFIMNAPFFVSSIPNRQRQDVDRRDFERLNNIEKEVTFLQFDSRGIRDEAYRENTQATMNGSSSVRKAARPFQKLVLAQQEKNKRDKSIRDRLIREKKQEQHKRERTQDVLNNAMVRPRPGGGLSKQHRNKKSMSSAFFQLMRPLSSAFTSDTLHAPGIKRTAAELDFNTTSKPSLVLSVVDARVAPFANNERSFTFQLDTEDGGHYLLQALSRKEMTKWLDTISRIAKIAAKRRLTYLGNSPKPQISDHLHDHAVAPSRDPTAVFGVNLQALLDREVRHGESHSGAIPFVIERCLAEVESRGLKEVGIYRIAGASSEINALKDAFNRGESPITTSTDIHAVCDLIKSWFRVLPEPVFPSSSYYDVIEAMKLENLDARLAKIRNVVRCLPSQNFDLLKRVSEHLDRVTDFEEYNQMTAEALAIVFSPNLLRAPQNDFVMILANMGHTHKLVKALITHFHVIFEEADPDAEVDQDEDDMDEPILEEDEEVPSPTPSTPESENRPNNS